jgi:ribosomal protein S18 acetylase RimI-like enzyme
VKAKYHIRPARNLDLPELARMRRALQDLLVAADPNILRLRDDRMAQSARFYAEVMARDDARVIVAADEDDFPIGMLMLRIISNPMTEPDRFGRIDDAWVEPPHRRRGIMRLMVGECVEILKAHGVRHVMLDYSVRNPVGEKCWLALGFHPMLTVTIAGVDELRLGREERTNDEL